MPFQRRDFEQVGIHWHLLVKGMDFISHEYLRSATKGRAYVVHIGRIRGSAIGYVTKYLTKQITVAERGLVEEQRVETMPMLEAVEDAVGSQSKPYAYQVKRRADGLVVEEQVVRRMSKARRIRYSRQFFSVSVAQLRQQLFGNLEEAPEQAMPCQEEGDAQPEVEQPSGWMLYEAESLAEDGRGSQERRRHGILLGLEMHEGETCQQAYKRRWWAALIEAVAQMQGWQRRISRRVINMWSYQRDELQRAG